MIELKTLLAEIQQLGDRLEEEWLGNLDLELMDSLSVIDDLRIDLFQCVKWHEADLTELKQRARALLEEHKVT